MLDLWQECVGSGMCCPSLVHVFLSIGLEWADGQLSSALFLDYCILLVLNTSSTLRVFQISRGENQLFLAKKYCLISELPWRKQRWTGHWDATVSAAHKNDDQHWAAPVVHRLTAHGHGWGELIVKQRVQLALRRPMHHLWKMQRLLARRFRTRDSACIGSR